MMGGALTIGQNNDELVEYLLETGYVRRKEVELVFRAVDRANYLLPLHQESAYKDLAWKHGNLHLSAPCVYGVAMEFLSLKPGQSFLNIGSGTGYFSTMAGLFLGPYGINHGIELHEDCLEYAREQLENFKQNSYALEEFEFCEPSFVQGNCLRVTPGKEYDAVYCGAAVSERNVAAIKRFVRIGGLVVMPYKGRLCCFTRTDENVWGCKRSLKVSFATLVVPDPADQNSITLPDSEPLSLQELCRSTVRQILRENVWTEYPELDKRYINTSHRRTRSNSFSKQSDDSLSNDDDDDDDEDDEEEDDDEDDEEEYDDDDEGEEIIHYDHEYQSAELDPDFVARTRLLFDMALDTEPTSNPLQLSRVAMLVQQRTGAVGQRVGAALDRIAEESRNDDVPMGVGSPSTNLEHNESSGMAENEGTDAVSVDRSSSEAVRSRGKQPDERTARRRESDTESDSEDELPTQWKKMAKRENSDSGIVEDVNVAYDDSSSSWSAVHSYLEADDDSMDVDLSSVALRKTFERACGEKKSEDPAFVQGRLFINYFKEKIQMLPLPETMKIYINHNRNL
ncbi:protein-L-isoaspartate O-methyltransferase domain-containing protein 1-like [Diprion similis]|uniref:protein-L-isoaspartate O-methyltransferase domain-containing protein 1-like n=1 Tax=Diprion similis TaxID=362088 RepID=UPI001EF768B4|nr:protein-L-isoaspartate O-methyltransferase domain-containing protein 1-like [Diprion similis]XP_046740438.1 protein-L-isoaspartate O-methyltransferase domain-containing protein 1-like [Diprion similis]